jgi:hypothetical protein
MRAETAAVSFTTISPKAMTAGAHLVKQISRLARSNLGCRRNGHHRNANSITRTVIESFMCTLQRTGRKTPYHQPNKGSRRSRHRMACQATRALRKSIPSAASQQHCGSAQSEVLRYALQTKRRNLTSGVGSTAVCLTDETPQFNKRGHYRNRVFQKVFIGLTPPTPYSCH